MKKYGYWFNALVTEKLSPISDDQKQFIAVFKNNQKPTTTAETAWYKYLSRLKLETEQPEKFNLHFEYEDDEFFSREDYYKSHPEKRNRK